MEGFILSILILANGLFAMAELAVVSSRRSKLRQKAEAGDAGAKAAYDLAASPSEFLSTVRSGFGKACGDFAAIVADSCGDCGTIGVGVGGFDHYRGIHHFWRVVAEALGTGAQ
jgi:hypothetical protein